MRETINWEDLVNRAKEGDQAAFDRLYDLSYKRVRATCAKGLKNDQDIEDAIQETYIKIYSSLTNPDRAPLKDPKKFLAWAGTIAHNEAVSLIGHKSRKQGKDDFLPPISDDQYKGMDALEVEETDRQFSPEDMAEDKAVHELLETALGNLPMDRQICLALSQQGLSYREISEKLSIPLGTVKSNIHYAKAQLQDEVEKLEEKYNIRIHGFTLALGPAGTVVPRFRIQWPGEGGEWIRAAVEADGAGGSGAGANGAAGDAVAKAGRNAAQKAAPASPRALLVRRIVALVLTVAIIGGGIIAAIHYSRQAVSPEVSQRSTTVAEEQVSPARGSQRNGRLNPQGRNQAAQGGEPAEQTTQAPATQAPTTQVTTREWQENGF